MRSCVLRMRAWQAPVTVLALAGLMVMAPAARADALFDAFGRIKAQAQALQGEAAAFAGQGKTHPFAAPQASGADTAFAQKVLSFSKASASLSAAIDARGGPRDLRCIYRGMASDAKKRLAALGKAANAGEQASIFKDMAALFADAVEVTPTSPSALGDRHDGVRAQCDADPDAKIESLPG